MQSDFVPNGRYASLEEVSRHVTSIPGTYSVRKELMLPLPNSRDNRKIIARDALIMFRNSELLGDNWHVPFLAPLNPDQRIYNIPLDLFQWPRKIVIRTPNSIALTTPGCPSCMDILIRAHNVPKFLWIELVYHKNKTRRDVVIETDPSAPSSSSSASTSASRVSTQQQQQTSTTSRLLDSDSEVEEEEEEEEEEE
jgi:hypothetical protein